MAVKALKALSFSKDKMEKLVQDNGQSISDAEPTEALFPSWAFAQFSPYYLLRMSCTIIVPFHMTCNNYFFLTIFFPAAGAEELFVFLKLDIHGYI